MIEEWKVGGTTRQTGGNWSGRFALPEDLAAWYVTNGRYLEQGQMATIGDALLKWDGAAFKIIDATFASTAEADAWVAKVGAPIATNSTATIAGTLVRYGGAGVGWVDVQKTTRNMVMKSQNSFVNFIGDSIVAGVLGGGTTLNAGSWVNRSIPGIEAKLNTINGCGFVLPTSNLYNDINSMWTIGAGWSRYARGAAGNAAFFSSTPGSILGFSPLTANKPFTGFYLLVYTGTNMSYQGIITATPSDGSPSVVIDSSKYVSGGGNVSLVKIPLIGKGANPNVTLQIAFTSGVEGFVLGCGVYDDTRPTINFRNVGVGASNSTHWVDGSMSQLTIGAIPASRTIIALGRNDILHSIPLSTYEANITTIVRIAKKTGDVAVASFPPASGALAIANDSAFVAAMRRVAASEVVDYIPFFEDVFDGTYQASLMADANHPNAEGYTAMSDRFVSWW